MEKESLFYVYFFFNLIVKVKVKPPLLRPTVFWWLFTFLFDKFKNLWYHPDMKMDYSFFRFCYNLFFLVFIMFIWKKHLYRCFLRLFIFFFVSFKYKPKSLASSKALFNFLHITSLFSSFGRYRNYFFWHKECIS